MQTAAQAEAFVSLRRAASRLGVPISWLKTEALAQRVPCLRVGRGRGRLLFSVNEVERTLLQRASGDAADSTKGLDLGLALLSKAPRVGLNG